MGPFIAGQVASEAGAGLVSQIVRTPEPQRGNALVVSGEQITAVGAECSGTQIAHIGKLPQACAGESIPDSETSVSDGSEGGGRWIGNDCVNVATGYKGETLLAGRYFPSLQILAFRGEQKGAGWIKGEYD